MSRLSSLGFPHANMYLLQGANCKRGGFVCEGYNNKVPWQKPSGKSPSIQTKQESSIISNGSPSNIPMSVPAGAQEHVIHQHILPQQPSSSFAVTQSPATIRVVERQAVSGSDVIRS